MNYILKQYDNDLLYFYFNKITKYNDKYTNFNYL